MLQLILILIPMLASLVLVALIDDKTIRSGYIAVAGALASLIFSLYYFSVLGGGTAVAVYSWFYIGSFNFQVSTLSSYVSVFATIIVSFISLMVIIFSLFYMKKEPQKRYYAEMSLFVFSMLALVISDSLLLLYVFWELVGISSFLLIGFYYEREKAAAAANKALIMTRIGDMALFAAIVILFVNYGTLSLTFILSNLQLLSSGMLLLVASLVTIAAISKSAQFPFYPWLPDAMEGPTTVSALLHSATMVAAGAYILILLSPLLSSAGMGTVISVIAIITAFIGAFLALHVVDMKRILAYSTIESLSFMFLAIGSLNAGGALYYLITHAIFKSLLFLITGALMVFFGTQDIRKLGTKGLQNSWLFLPFLAGILSLAGFPPFMGFFAHLTLSHAFGVYGQALFVVLSFLTSLFAFRLLFTVFRSGALPSKKMYYTLSSALPIFLLAAITLFGGISLFYMYGLINASYSLDVSTLIDLIASFVGVLSAFWLFGSVNRNYWVSRLSSFADSLSSFSYNVILQLIGASVVYLGRSFADFDDALTSFYESVAKYSLILSFKSRRIEDGDVQTYISVMLIGLIIVLAVAVVFL